MFPKGSPKDIKKTFFFSQKKIPHPLEGWGFSLPEFVSTGTSNATLEAKVARMTEVMMCAAQNGHVEVVDRLLAAGADKDAQDKVPGCA